MRSELDMPKESTFDAEATVSDVAKRFLNRFSRSAREASRSGFDPTVVQNKEESASDRFNQLQVTNRRSPLAAAFFALVLPGGGLLFVRRWFLAFLFLSSLAASLVMSLSALGALPIPVLLRDWGIPLTHSEQLLASGIATAFLWWVSLVIPVGVAARTARFRKPVSRFGSLLSAPIPILGAYVRRWFVLGHLTALAAVLAVIGSLLAYLFWQLRVEREFVWSAVLASAAGSLFALLYLGAWLGAFRDLGCGRSGREGARTDVKFALLGFGLILFFAAYKGPMPLVRALGPATQKAQLLLKAKGFQSTSGRIKAFYREADRSISGLDDRLSLFR
ncbi:MAG: hypothetical protein V1798_09195 [Pseudomonadota bacterium]